MLGWWRWLVNSFRAPVRPGSAIALKVPPRAGARYGTLGCVILRDGQRFGLTCDHVLPDALDGAPVNALVGRSRRARRIGTVHEPDGRRRRGDCALIRIDRHARVKARHPRPIEEISGEPLITGSLMIRSERSQERPIEVQFMGAASKYKTGAALIGAASRVYRTASGDRELLPPYIEIKPDYVSWADDGFHAARSGDSGSLVLTSRSGGALPQPLGLLVAVREDALGNRGLAVPIARVLGAVGNARIQT